MLLHQITLKNLLSFGPDSKPLELRPLNVLIGPNGSGKSNLIDAISLLQAAPRELASPIRDGGGIGDWLWKGASNPRATLDVVVDNPDGSMPLRHTIVVAEVGRRFTVIEEAIENSARYQDAVDVAYFYRLFNNQPVINAKSQPRLPRQLFREDIDPEKSILSQKKDRDEYPELTRLGVEYERIRIYRDWTFGRSATPRLPQKPDQRNDFLLEDCSNLGLVLNRLRRVSGVKKRLIELAERVLPNVTDVDVSVEGGTVQVMLQEGDLSIPATRLSDGTLRFLCLVAVLVDPAPPPLICIEEPELGLHPDVVPTIAGLLKEASERTQLIVTTHSSMLVDCFNATPEVIVVCEKQDGQTQMNRLDPDELASWLEKYQLADLWSRGLIGGNRW